MRPEDFNPIKVAEHLQGTCGTLQGALDDLYEGMNEDELTSDDHQTIDQEVFQCTTCGWWCEISDNVDSESGEMICTDCGESGEGDGD
jgi:anaerobic selenocysteine-containing dehydrogenase